MIARRIHLQHLPGQDTTGLHPRLLNLSEAGRHIFHIVVEHAGLGLDLADRPHRAVVIDPLGGLGVGESAEGSARGQGQGGGGKGSVHEMTPSSILFGRAVSGADGNQVRRLGAAHSGRPLTIIEAQSRRRRKRRGSETIRRRGLAVFSLIQIRQGHGHRAIARIGLNGHMRTIRSLDHGRLDGDKFARRRAGDGVKGVGRFGQ